MARDRPVRGVSVRRELDVPTFREITKDPRHWVSYAYVASVTDSGVPDDADPKAVLTAPRGVMVDVVLVPSEEPCTCRYAGIQGGPAVTMYAPIHPGDEVLVVMADGELGLPPVIVAVMNSKVAKLPVEADGKPVFRNDRLSIYARGVPIEVRNDAGAKVRMEADGDISMVPADGKTVYAGGTSGTEAAALGDTIQRFMGQVQTWLDTHTHPVPGVTVGTGATTSSPPGVPGPSPVPPTVTSSNVQVKV